MDKENMIEALRTGIGEYTKQIEELEAERDVAKRMLARFSGNGQTEIQGTVAVTKSAILGPTEAMKYLFDTFPNKKWKAVELRDRLRKMKDEGSLNSQSSELIKSVYYLLRRFIDREYIDKHSYGQNSWYIKKNVEN